MRYVRRTEFPRVLSRCGVAAERAKRITLITMTQSTAVNLRQVHTYSCATERTHVRRFRRVSPPCLCTSGGNSSFGGPSAPGLFRAIDLLFRQLCRELARDTNSIIVTSDAFAKREGIDKVYMSHRRENQFSINWRKSRNAHPYNCFSLQLTNFNENCEFCEFNFIALENEFQENSEISILEAFTREVLHLFSHKS